MIEFVPRSRGQWTSTRRFRAVAVLGVAILACAAGTIRRPERSGVDLPLDEARRRVASAIRDWFAFLGEQDGGLAGLQRLFSSASLELSFVGGTLRTRDELEAWIASLRSTYPRAEYRVESLTVEPVGEDVYRARFEVERRAWDHAGLLHLARREHIWVLGTASGEGPILQSAVERVLPYYPGTGPRLLCF